MMRTAALAVILERDLLRTEPTNVACSRMLYLRPALHAPAQHRRRQRPPLLLSAMSRGL
jgi:hypothetical protein